MKKKIIDPHGGKVYHLQHPNLLLILSSIPFCFGSLPHEFQFLSFTFLYPMTLLYQEQFLRLLFCWSDLTYGCRDGSWSLILSSLISCPSVFVYSCLHTWNETFFSQLSSFSSTNRNINLGRLELTLICCHLTFIFNTFILGSSISIFFYLLISFTLK